MIRTKLDGDKRTMKNLKQLCASIHHIDVHKPEHRARLFKSVSSAGLTGMLATEHLPQTSTLIALGIIFAAVHTIFWIWSE